MRLSSITAIRICLLILLVFSNVLSQTRSTKALVGGTLIDGYGSAPITIELFPTSERKENPFYRSLANLDGPPDWSSRIH